MHWHVANRPAVLAYPGIALPHLPLLLPAADLGWRIRTSDDADEVATAQDLHPKLAVGMATFFALGALGGSMSLLMQVGGRTAPPAMLCCGRAAWSALHKSRLPACSASSPWHALGVYARLMPAGAAWQTGLSPAPPQWGMHSPALPPATAMRIAHTPSAWRAGRPVVPARLPHPSCHAPQLA